MGLELGFKDPFVASAYADDMSLLLKNEQDLQEVVGALQIYQRASSAKVNLGRVERFCVGLEGNQRSHSCQGV